MNRTSGETWQLIGGDALDVLAGLAPGTFDAVITDPPYSSGGMFRGDRADATTAEKYVHNKGGRLRPDFAGDNMDQRAWQSWCVRWLSLARAAGRPGCYLAVFTDWRQLPALTDAVQWAGWTWRGVLVWDKTEGAKAPHQGYFNYQSEFLVWGTSGRVPRKPSRAEGGQGRMPGVYREAVKPHDKHHQAGKPVDLMRWLVRCAPTGGRVLDPFAGSGTTGVACLREGRSFTGVELTREYLAIAARRLQDEQNLKEGRVGLFADLP